MASHSSTRAREIPWTEEPGRSQYLGFQRVKHDLACTHTHTHTHTYAVYSLSIRTYIFKFALIWLGSVSLISSFSHGQKYNFSTMYSFTVKTWNRDSYWNGFPLDCEFLIKWSPESWIIFIVHKLFLCVREMIIHKIKGNIPWKFRWLYICPSRARGWSMRVNGKDHIQRTSHFTLQYATNSKIKNKQKLWR